MQSKSSYESSEWVLASEIGYMGAKKLNVNPEKNQGVIGCYHSYTSKWEVMHFFPKIPSTVCGCYSIWLCKFTPLHEVPLINFGGLVLQLLGGRKGEKVIWPQISIIWIWIRNSRRKVALLMLPWIIVWTSALPNTAAPQTTKTTSLNIIYCFVSPPPPQLPLNPPENDVSSCIWIYRIVRNSSDIRFWVCPSSGRSGWLLEITVSSIIVSQGGSVSLDLFVWCLLQRLYSNQVNKGYFRTISGTEH